MDSGACPRLVDTADQLRWMISDIDIYLLKAEVCVVVYGIEAKLVDDILAHSDIRQVSQKERKGWAELVHRYRNC